MFLSTHVTATTLQKIEEMMECRRKKTTDVNNTPLFNIPETASNYAEYQLLVMTSNKLLYLRIAHIFFHFYSYYDYMSMPAPVAFTHITCIIPWSRVHYNVHLYYCTVAIYSHSC